MTNKPELYCPFDSGINPLAESANAATSRWVRRFGLIDAHNLESRVTTERYTWLVGRFFPSAQEKTLQFIADWTSWLFWHDDVCDETELGSDPEKLSVTFKRLFAILSRQTPPDTTQPFELALADLANRLNVLAHDKGWLYRFLTSASEYFDACSWEARNRVQGVVPSIGQFIALRRCASGMWMYKDFVELALGRSLPLELRQNRDVQRMVQITQNVACWHNDIFSLEKELQQGDVHNLVMTIHVEQGLSIERAKQVAVSYADAEVHAFLALRGKLPALAPELSQYVDGLAALMRGNLDWSLESTRYRSQSLDERRNSEIRDLASPAITLTM